MLARYDDLVTAERVRQYSWIAVTLYAVFLAGWILASKDGVDPARIALGADFVQFHIAARMALAGQAPMIYDAATLQAAAAALFPTSDNPFLWNYPPSFLLIVAPLGLLPYFPALALFVVSGLALYVAAARKIVPHRLAPLFALACPGAFMTVLHGQNGFIAASALALGLVLLPKKPVLAGLLLGLVSYKPQLGILLPFLLAASGQWRAFLSAAVSVLFLVGLSAYLFSPDAWIAFFRNLPRITEIVQGSSDLWPRMASVFAAASLLGAPTAVAMALQSTATIAAVVLTAWGWSKPGPWDVKASLAVMGTLIASPYLMNYDLVLLAIPVALMARHIAARGYRPGAAMLFLAAFSPFLLGLARITQVQVVAVVLWVFYVAIWRELARSRGLADTRAAAGVIGSPAIAAR